MNRRRSEPGVIAMIIFACVFGTTMLLSLTGGAEIYRRVSDRVETASEVRISLSYIVGKIHAHDRAGTVRAGRFGGQDAIFLSQTVDDVAYETILYVYDGKLMELLCEQGWELAPEDGQVITEGRSLTVAEPLPGLLRLCYTDIDGDAQTADVYIRSGEL